MLTKRRILAAAAVVLVMLLSALLLISIYDFAETLMPKAQVLLSASEGSMVRVRSVQEGAVQFLSGSGSVTVYSPAQFTVLKAVLIVLTVFALKGALSFGTTALRLDKAASDRSSTTRPPLDKSE